MSRSAGFLWGAVEAAGVVSAERQPSYPRAREQSGQRGLQYGFHPDAGRFACRHRYRRFRAYASLGVVNTDGNAASVSGSVVSREHWLGWRWAADDAFCCAQAASICLSAFGRSSTPSSSASRRAPTERHPATRPRARLQRGHLRGEMMAHCWAITRSRRTFIGSAATRRSRRSRRCPSRIRPQQPRDARRARPSTCGSRTRARPMVCLRAWPPFVPLVLLAEADLWRSRRPRPPAMRRCCKPMSSRFRASPDRNRRKHETPAAELRGHLGAGGSARAGSSRPMRTHASTSRSRASRSAPATSGRRRSCCSSTCTCDEALAPMLAQNRRATLALFLLVLGSSSVAHAKPEFPVAGTASSGPQLSGAVQCLSHQRQHGLEPPPLRRSRCRSVREG